MKKILLSSKNREKEEGFVWYYPKVCCTKCGRVMKRMNSELSNRTEHKIVLYQCNCDDRPVVLYQDDTVYGKEVDKWIKKLDIDESEIKRYKNVEVWNNTLEGITFNEENSTLSIYKMGFDYFVPLGQDRLIWKRYIERVSLNVKSGKMLSFSTGHRKKEKNGFARHDLTAASYIPFSFSKEAMTAFCQSAIELSGLSIYLNVHDLPKNEYGYSSIIDRIYGISLDGNKSDRLEDNENELFDDSIAGMSVLIADLIAAPNILVSYDSYTKKSRFRINEGKVKDPYCGIYLNKKINIVMPKTSAFRKLQPREMMDTGEYIKMICAELDIPASRKLKKMYLMNPMLMGFVSFLKEAGIKREDNIHTMIDLLLHDQYIFEWNSSFSSKAGSFLRNLIASNGETVAVNKIASYIRNNKWHKNELIDAVEMYSLIANKHHIPVELTGNIKQIHDRLSEKMKLLEVDNICIRYSKKELGRTGAYGRYEICVAEDTERLVDIGEKMKICVGSYTNVAINKKDTIYYFKDSVTNKYAACIELKRNVLIQAKGYCNQYLTGSV